MTNLANKNIPIPFIRESVFTDTGHNTLSPCAHYIGDMMFPLLEQPKLGLNLLVPVFTEASNIRIIVGMCDFYC